MADMRSTLLSTFFDWRTPEWFLDLVRDVAPIAFDPATSPDNPARAAVFYTQSLRTVADGDDDAGEVMPGCGLDYAWPETGLGFINPRYGAYLSGPVDPQYEHWKDGAITGYGRGWARKIASHEGEHIALVPVRTDTRWWKEIYRHSNAVCLWSSPTRGVRISFIDPSTGEEVKGSNSASTVFYRGPNVSRFAEVFRPHGTLIPGGLYEWCSI